MVVLKNCFNKFCDEGNNGFALIRLSSLNGSPLKHSESDTYVADGRVWEAQIIDDCWVSCDLPCNSEFEEPSFYEVVEFVNGEKVETHQFQFDCLNNCYPHPLNICDAKNSFPCEEEKMPSHYPKMQNPYPAPCTCPSCEPASHHGCSGPCEPQEQACHCALNIEDSDSVDLHLSGSGSSSSPWVVSADIKIDPMSPAAITVTEHGLSVACCEEHEHEADVVTSLTDNGDGTFTYVNEEAVSVTVSYCCDDVVTTLVQNADGTYTYTNEDGVETLVDFDDVVTTLVDNGDGTFTYTSEDGTETIISFDPSDDNTTYVLSENGDSIVLTSSSGEVQTINICDIVEQFCPETVTTLTLNQNGFTYISEDGTETVFVYPSDSLVDNDDGTYTHTAVDGVVTVIDVCQCDDVVTTLVDNGDSTYVYTSEDGTQTTIDVSNDSNTTYVLTEAAADGSITLFGSDGSESTLDICQLIEDYCPTPAEVVTTLVDNGDSSFTYTNEDGVTSTIAYCCDDVVTTLVANADGSYTYTNEDGVLTNISFTTSGPDTNTTYDLTFIGGSIIQLTGSDGSTDNIDICSIIEGNCSDSLIDNGDGTYTHIAVNNLETVIDVCAAMQEGGCVPSLVSNNDGTYTFDDGFGNTTIISPSDLNTTYDLVNNGDGTLSLTGSDGTVDVVDICCEDTVTTLIANADGSFTYTSEDGTETVISFTGGGGTDTNTLYDIVSNGDGTISLVGSDGTTDTVDICCDDVLTTLVDNGDDSFTYTNENGVAVTIDYCCEDTVTTLVQNADGSYTYTSEDGTQTVINFAGGTDTNTTYDLTYLGGGTIQLVGSDGTTDDIDICAIIEGNCSDSLVDNGDGTYTHTGVNNSTTIIDVCAAMVDGGCVPSLVNNGNGTYTFDDGFGNTTVINQPTANDTNTTYDLVLNGNQTVSLIGSDGTTDTVDICCDDIVTTLVANANGTYTYTSEDGTVTVITPDEAEWEYVQYDPNVHVDGNSPAGTGTTANPYQIPLPCDCCFNRDEETCCVPSTVFDDSALGTPGATEVASFNEIGFGQHGSEIFSDDLFPSTFQLNVPAASPGCVIILQLSWLDQQDDLFGADAGAGSVANVTLSSGTNVTAPTLIHSDSHWPQGNAPDGTIFQNIYAFDVNSAGSGSTITVNYPLADSSPTVDGAVMWVWHEICGISVADLGTPIVTSPTQDSPVNNGNNPDPAYNWIQDTDPVNAGECDALYMGYARHVGYDLTAPTDLDGPLDTSWATPSAAGAIEFTDHASGIRQNSALCQIGTTSGVIPGGSGPVSWTVGQNFQVTNNDQKARIVVLPLTSCGLTGPGTGNTVSTAGCSMNLTHPCDQGNDAIHRTTVFGGAKICAGPGNHFCVYPVINGVQQTSQVAEVDNRFGDSPICVSIPSTSNVVHGAVSAGANATTVTVRYTVVAHAFASNPLNSVTVHEFCATSELEVI